MDGKGEMPTAAALVLARASQRVALKHQDLSLLRAAKDLEKRALSAVKKRQSVLSNDTLSPTEQSEMSSKAPARAQTPSEMDEMSSQHPSDPRERPTAKTPSSREMPVWARGQLGNPDHDAASDKHMNATLDRLIPKPWQKPK
jgi:hypothetical protein